MVSHRIILHYSRRALLWGAGLIVVTLLALWLVLQFVILKDVDRYRPDVIAALSKATGTRVEISNITSARFEWLPTVILDHVTIYDPQGKPGLELNRVTGRISLLGFFSGRTDLSTLIIDQPSLSLRKAADGQFFLSGIPLPRPDSGPSQFLEWLVNQGDIRVTNATIHWVDDSTKAPPLLFTQGSFRIRNSGSHHRIDLAFTPPKQLSNPVTLRADFYGTDLADFKGWYGSVITQSDQVDLGALRPWIPQLSQFESAHGQLKITFSMERLKQWGVQAEGDVTDLVVRLKPGLSALRFDHLHGGLSFKILDDGFDLATQQLVASGESSIKTTVPLDMHLLYTGKGGALEINHLELAQLTGIVEALPLSGDQRVRWNNAGLKGRVSHLNLTWQGSQDAPTDYAVHSDFTDFQANPQRGLPALRGFSGHLDAAVNGGQLKGKGADATLNFPEIFAVPIQVRAYTLDTSWTFQEDRTEIQFNRLEVENTDLAGYVTGNLSVGPEGPGEGKLSGELERAQPAAIWRYLPLKISETARKWVQAAVVGGTARHVVFEVKGNLQQFPFAQDQGGKFRVSAQITDGVLHYDPNWPGITGIQGSLAVQGSTLTIDATDGLILGSKIKSAHARIPDLAQGDQQLSVTGEVDASLPDGLNFISKSPVAKFINHATDAMQGMGAGNLNLSLQIPLGHPRDTQIKGDYQFLNATMDDGEAGIPPISQLQGHLLFTEKALSAQGLTATVLGGPAVFELSTQPSGVIRVVGQGNANMAGLYSVYHQPILMDVSGKQDWKGEFSFSEKTRDIKLQSQVAYLGEPVSVQISTQKDGTLDVALKGKTSQSSLMKRYPNALSKALDSPVDWNGHIRISASGRDEVNIAGTALILQEPTKLVVSGAPRGKLETVLSGKVAISALRRLGYGVLAGHAKGTTGWQARIVQEGARTHISVTSNLLGVAVDLPEPFHKKPQEELPLTLDWTTEGNARQISGALGNLLGVRVAYAVVVKGGVFQARRGVINFGGEAPALPPEGFVVTGTLRHADLDLWKKMSSDISNDAREGGFFGPISGVKINLEDIRWYGRTWGTNRITAAQERNHWQIQIRGSEADGEITWIPEDSGQVRAHFTKLVIPVAPAQNVPAATPVDPNAQKNMPSVDLVAESFGAFGKTLGRLQLVGVRDAGLWRLNRFSLTSPQGTLEGDGHWAGGPTPQTQVNLHLKASDLGKFLANAGYSGMVSRGSGEVLGKISWSGNPEDFTLLRTTGQFSLDLHDGQFSKVEPGGAGRLIGLLSLQTLPRRITLDFNDIFSDGFAFDTLTGNFSMNLGILSTHDFDMNGPAARVMLSGTVNIPAETTDLKAKVSPQVGNSVSLASTVIGGPIAGAVSYLLQKLLKNPIDKALTYEYAIEGNWDDPKIKPIGSSAGSTTAPYAP